MNKTRLAEIRHKDKLKKDKKEIRSNNKKHKKQNKKIRKREEDYKKYNRQLQKTKKLTKLQKKKEYELNKRRKLIRIQNESNKETKQNERRQKRENIVEDIDIGRYFELATTDRKYVNGLNLHEIKIEFLEDYTGDFELIGSMLVGEIEQKTNNRFKDVDDFEGYINTIDNSGSDSEDVILTGWLYKLNTPEFKKVNRSQYGRGTDFKQDIVEYIGNNCYIPTSGNCFIKCIKYFIKKDYTEELLTFIRTEQRRSNVMTSARVQPFCRNHNIVIGCYDAFRVCPRNIAKRNMSLKIHNNHFCLIWKSNGVSFDRAIKELKDNFRIVDNVISDKHVKSYIKYEYNPKKDQSQLTNMIVYNIETFSTIKCVPYANCIYKLNKFQVNTIEIYQKMNIKNV